MQEEIRVSIQQKIDTTVPEEESHQAIFKDVVGILEGYIKVIKDNPEMDSYLDQISITPNELIQNFQKIIASFKELNMKSRKNKTTYYTTKFIWQHLQTFLKAKNLQSLDTKGKTVWLLQVETKLGCSVDLMHDMKAFQDITNSPKQNFAEVWQRITIIQPNDTASLLKDTKKTKKMLHVAASAVINEHSHDFYLTKIISFGLSFPRYMIMNDSAKLRSFKFYRTPTIQIAQKFWNLPEQGATKQFAKITYQGIKTNKKIYLPPKGEITSQTDIFTENSQHIQVRILYSKKLHIFEQAGSCCIPKKKEIEMIDTVLIHMHGGGFVALSSRSMQAYTRKWANALNVPIFSIDYRMPPNHPFPTAPQDCLIVYKFLLNHVDKFMNISPKNIYISGDSAGGNLTCSLTGLILKDKLPIPRGLYVAYPAVDLRMMFTLSRIYSLTDILLWPPMLLLCLNSYLSKDFSQAESPVASPLLLTEEYVNGTAGDKRFPLKWPKTIVTVGSKDPLLDDSLMLMQKMVESNIQCECILYEGLSHGYLSTKMLIQQTGRTIVDSIEHLKRLMGIEAKKK